MYLVRAIIRPEKVNTVLSELVDAGFPQVTKMDVFGRVVRDEDKDDVVRVIMKNSRTGEKGTYGDGKVFVSKVDTAYTISTGKEEL